VGAQYFPENLFHLDFMPLETALSSYSPQQNDLKICLKRGWGAHCFPENLFHLDFMQLETALSSYNPQ
jgi:hypothetical protein